MTRSKAIFVTAALLLLSVCSYATESAFMGFDVQTQKMYAVVVGDAPIHAQITYTQSNPDGYVGETSTYVPEPVQIWGEAPLSPTDPSRFTDLPDNTMNVITAEIAIYDANNQYLYTMYRTDTLLADVNGPNGFYTYTDPTCTPVLPDTIRINTAFCAWICHGSYTVPIYCEALGYDPNTIEVTVTPGCDPTEYPGHCNDASCPRVDMSQFSWFRRVFSGCRLYLTMTYCNATPGCVCIWRSDFFLPVSMGAFDATAGDGAINLRWDTESESGTNGFIVTRSGSRDGVYSTIYSRPAAGNSTTPRSYSWTDTGVQNGSTYYYKLHVTDINGNHVWNQDGETRVVSATPGAANSGVPMEYSVMNYPNPFNSNTTFAFALPFADHVSLKVYDLLGREVATIVDRDMPAGTYSMNWSADGMPSGVYMYTLKSGEFSRTNKLLYVK